MGGDADGNGDDAEKDWKGFFRMFPQCSLVRSCIIPCFDFIPLSGASTEKLQAEIDNDDYSAVAWGVGHTKC